MRDVKNNLRFAVIGTAIVVSLGVGARSGLATDAVAGRAGSDFWSLQPIRRPAVPKVGDASRARNAIDAFVLARLETAGLGLSPEADRRTLIRRLSFDLTGLPPSPEAVDAFVNDPAPTAYQALVERLLASPRYGERWARHWLDVVRFCESRGYERDRIRHHAWRYRDYVIGAFNDDKPYAEFVREQLAGDALHPDADDAGVATGFLVTGPDNDVGNQSKLETLRTRADELDEFVNNTSAVFLGLTVACARCHDHKFDPIPTADYYRLAAVFSGVKFGDRPLVAPTALARHRKAQVQTKKRRQEIDQRLTALRAELDALAGKTNPIRNEVRFAPVEARFVRFTILRTTGGTQPAVDELELYGPASDENLALASRGARAAASSLLPGYAIHQIAHLNDGQVGNEHSWISNEPGRGWAQIELPQPSRVSRLVWGRDRKGRFKDRVAAAFEVAYSADGTAFHAVETTSGSNEPTDAQRAAVARLHAERKALRAEKAKVADVAQAWAVVSVEPSEIHVLLRGDVRTPGEAAPPAGLRCVQALPAELPIDADTPEPQRRLKLADWIAHPDNALTWRVIVNRVWHYHFGAGIVPTTSDFGYSGDRPSHPELLDWLADEFRQRGGRLKDLHRLIVLSSTYRQSSASRADGNAVDAGNRLRWRQNRRRIEAESVRDAVLFVSGKLDLTLGGRSYRPFHYVEGNIPVYKPLAESPAMWRRTIYRHVARTHRSAFLDSFDCPDPSVMTPVRARTTTPLQALSLLNNPFMVEHAGYFAERVAQQAGERIETQVRRAYRLAMQREPRASELAATVSFAERHGLMSLCRVLMNTNEFLYVD